MKTPLLFLLTAAMAAHAENLPAEDNSFPTPEQIRTAREAAQKEHPISEQLIEQVNEGLGAYMGLLIADSFKTLSTIDVDLFQKAFDDEWNNPAPVEERARELEKQMKPLSEKMRQLEKADMERREAAFLRENAKKPGVTVLKNGMQYTVKKSGSEDGNIFIDEAKRIECSTVTGTLAYIRDGSIGENDLPSCVNEIMDELPDGEEWMFYIPRELLEEEKTITASPLDTCGIIVLTVKSGSKVDSEDADEDGGDDEA